MQLFTGQYERTIDAKNRIQLPSQLRGAIDLEADGNAIYVTLGEDQRTLSLYTRRGLEELAARLETEFSATPRAREFERQFYALTSTVEIDKQGRIVIPDRLRKKARLGEEVYLVGQKNRIEIWNRADLNRSLGIDWEGDDWPEWQSFIRKRPKTQRE